MGEFKVGDRVKATLGANVLVGDVSEVNSNDRVRLVCDNKQAFWVAWHDGWHIEKVSPPLPTKQYAVVGNSRGRGWVGYTLVENKWYCVGPSPYQASKSEVEEAIRDLGFEVIFEGVHQ